VQKLQTRNVIPIAETVFSWCCAVLVFFMVTSDAKLTNFYEFV